MLCWCFRHKFPPHLPVSVPGELSKHQSKQSVPGELSKHQSKQSVPGELSKHQSKQSVPGELSKHQSKQSQRWWCRASCPWMSVDILGTNCDQCRRMVQCCFTSTEPVGLMKATSTFTQLLNSESQRFSVALRPQRRVGLLGMGTEWEGGERVKGSTTETARKRPERPWTAARTIEVLRRCPLAIAQRLVHCAIVLSTAVLDRVTKTMSVAPLLTNNLDNSKQKTSNLLSPAPPPYSWSLLGKSQRKLLLLL